MSYKHTKYVFEKKNGTAYYSLDTTTGSPFHGVQERSEGSEKKQDWSKFTEHTSITIDGMSLEQLLKNEGKSTNPKDGNYFSSENGLKEFFKNHLVSRIPETRREAASKSQPYLVDFLPEMRDEAVDQLMRLLEQGGLRPATTAANQAFRDLNKNTKVTGGTTFFKSNASQGTAQITAPALDPKPDNEPAPIWHERALNFVTTEKGFILQEVITQKALFVTNGTETLKISPDDPNGEKPYVYQALMTIDVDLTGDEGKAKTTVINCGINYGSTQAQDMLDARRWWAKFVDAARRFFQLDSSKIRDLSKGRDDEDEHVEEHNSSLCSPPQY